MGNRHGKITELSEWMDDHWSERGNGERERSLFLFCTRIGKNCNIIIVDMFAFIVPNVSASLTVYLDNLLSN